MGEMEYKTVPLPTTPRKFKGVKNPVDRTSRTLTEILNEEARGGWSFLRAEQIEVVVPTGMMRRKRSVETTLLIFQRVRTANTRASTARRTEPQAAVAIEPPVSPAPEQGLRSTD